MAGVVIELRPLVAAEGVLDRQLVEPELGLDLVDVRFSRLAVVDPHDRSGHRQELGHVRDREALFEELAVAIGPRVCHGLSGGQLDRRSLFFFCLSARFSLSVLPGFFALCFSGTLFAMPPA